jgi:hypothetical protein
LSRYAPKFVNMEVKKIASLKGGYVPNWWRPCAIASVQLSMSLSVILSFKRTVMLYMLLLRTMRNLMNPKHLRPILLWWLHLNIIHRAYPPDIIHIRKRVRSRGAVLRKESLRHRQVTGHVGIVRC